LKHEPPIYFVSLTWFVQTATNQWDQERERERKRERERERERKREEGRKREMKLE